MRMKRRLFAICRPDLPQEAQGLPNSTSLKESFLDVLADENLRERVSVKTEPIRNLILSLAFGSLAAEPKDKV
jgi:hypothetical protein